jgi:iron complex outermembrane receptor protein
MFKKFSINFLVCLILAACNLTHAQQPTATPTATSTGTILEEIQVNSTISKKDLSTNAKPVAAINKDALRLKDTTSLGSALQDELGVNASAFGQAASRPVIRGLGGDRVRILENGVGTNDVSSTSPDHPVNVDLLGAESVEILRGPAALRYGTTAVGGVVNILDNKIPDALPDYLMNGELQLKASSNGRERSSAIQTTAAVSDNVAVHVEASARKSDDYRVPNMGRLNFSDTQNSNVSIGSSYIDGKSFIGIAGTYMDSVYGVPNGEEDISIDMRQPKLELRGNLDKPLSFLRSISLNSSISDYKHTEFEGTEVGTVFTNKASDTRLEFNHKPIADGLQGLLGVQFQSSRFESIGEEAYQAPTATDVISTYIIEDYDAIKDKLSFNAGLRSDFQSTDVSNYTSGFDETFYPTLSKDFSTFSQSIGANYFPINNYTIGLSLARTERAPVGQELFANGPHAATSAFEIGDPNLESEKSVGIDLTIKRNEGLITGSLGGFSNRFSNYIGLNPTGNISDDLPEFRFESQRAQFYGIESSLELHLWGQSDSERAQNDLTFFTQQDWVWAKDIDTNEAIARVPPFRIKAGVKYQKETLGASIYVLRVNSQDRVANSESSTDGYTFLNASITKEVFELGSNNSPAELFLRGENLTNEEARNHVSFIKEQAPLPGRNIIAGIRFNF